MQAYLITSSTIFGLLVVAHIVRIVGEGTQVVDRWFVLITVLAAALCAWAWRLLLVQGRARSAAR